MVYLISSALTCEVLVCELPLQELGVDAHQPGVVDADRHARPDAGVTPGRLHTQRPDARLLPEPALPAARELRPGLNDQLGVGAGAVDRNELLSVVPGTNKTRVDRFLQKCSDY